jgi:hypothetical protein
MQLIREKCNVMARLKGNSLHNAFTGKVGNLVGCKWKDTYYIRMRPVSVKHPNTEAQLAQRMRFANTQSFLQPMKEFLRLGFGAYTSNKSAYNAAMSYNMKNAIIGEYPDIVIDPSLAMVSMGKLPGCSDVAVLQKEPQLLEFSWDSKTNGSSAHSNDRVILVHNCPDNKKATYRLDAASRRDGKVTVMVNEFSGFSVACYILFVKPRVMLGNFTDLDISDSQYCGTIEVSV